jgi:hypothetical protein
MHFLALVLPAAGVPVPLDRIAKVNKTGDDTETYIHDSNNVVSQTIKGTTTTFNYARNRLLTAVSGGATDNYNYDPFGRLDTVTAARKVVGKCCRSVAPYNR